MADLSDSFDSGERRSEADGGAEECRTALPLVSRLSLHQALLAVGTGHEQRRRVHVGKRLRFSRRSYRED